MAPQKTMPTVHSVEDFIEKTAVNEQQKKDSYSLVNLMEEITGQKAAMWGPSIIGFGKYHYKYESGHAGDALLVGFSPRKTAISLYVFTGAKEHEPLLTNLGKFKRGKACIYINKLSDIDEARLRSLIISTIDFLRHKYGVSE